MSGLTKAGSSPGRRGRIAIAQLALAFLASSLGACTESASTSAPPPPAAAVASLGGEVGARVGSELIPLALVTYVATAQGVDARASVSLVVDDEVAASAARARKLDEQQPAAWLLRTTRAKLVATRILDDAKRAGPPTDDEVRALSDQHSSEVDRPPAFRTVHAVVLWPKDAAANDVALKNAARQLASAIRVAVVAASDAEFEERAKAVKRDADPAVAALFSKLDVRVEHLPPITADGRVVDQQGSMDPAFSRAASVLEPGATSPVVESKFGAHVIRLLERFPEKRMPFEERRLAFAEEVYSRRAHQALRSLLEKLRADKPIGISTSAEALMRPASLAVAGAAPGPSVEGQP